MNKKLAIFGTSGFAYEVADIAFACEYSEVVLIADTYTNMPNPQRIRIIQESEIQNLIDDDFYFAIGIGEPNVRERVYDNYKTLRYPNLIHPRASFGHEQLTLINQCKGNIITSGVVFTNNIIVGDFGIYNLNTTIGHDCIIGHFVSIMPSVNISGNVQLCDKVYLGVGAVVLQGSHDKKLTVNSNSTVGAASLVTKNVEENVTVIGSPAKELKR
jgi:sugar O-acyltransferase (sialic acid O-acetyltransferase NeuD family)